MDVELFTEDTSGDETYGLDDYSEDYLNFESERCGICSDVVIDRGVLDCCQHWFCFTCIDNWATITNVCPLCQNEFQLITCVPVHDTVGGSKTDDDTSPTRDDDWLIEGKNNTLSFPSYYIDENAVVCLDGDGCKIRSGFVAIEEDSDIDTSIACDLCDKWYHAFCVGFDPEGTSDSSWLCPRCTTDKVPQESGEVSEFRKSYQKSLEISDGDSPAETSFSGRVSVSVADDGETAVVVSLLTGNQGCQKSSEYVLGHKDMENALLSHSASDMPKSKALPDSEPYLCQPESALSLSQDTSLGSSCSILPTQLKTNANDSVKIAPEHLNSAIANSGLNLGRDMKYDGVSEDHVPASVESDKRLEDSLPTENMVPNKVEDISSESLIADVNDNIKGAIGVKRKPTDHSDSEENVNNGEQEDDHKAKISPKKLKAEEYWQPSSLVDQTSILEGSSTIKCQSTSRDGIVRATLEKDKANNATSIMDIVRGTDRKSLKQLGHKNPSNIADKERESAAGFRLKKIMRRTGDDQDSSVLVQEIRQKLREAVRSKSSNEPGQNIFDPKLLDAFRTALAGSGAENRKSTLDVKAKKALLQKGKIRENLTKKIYGAGGKRKRAWTRECEVEFWKHRCIKVSKPEKIQTLKSVLDVLRDKSDSEKKIPGNEEAAKVSILSRLYLADTSLLPRKNDIKPVSDISAVTISEQKSESGVTGKVSSRLPIDQPDRIHQKDSSDSQVAPPLEGKDTKKLVKGTKADNVSAEAHWKRDSTGTHAPASSGAATSAKNAVSKLGDKRKWALEFLARKTATSGKNAQENDEDPTILKENYTLLAQLPKEMRPGLAPSRHNKIPLSVRQAQLYRLAEHFLKKANLSVVCRTAETELAVADAVNIEKQIADRSNSKLVYVNLCSQELLRRPDNANPDRAKETNVYSTNSEHLSDEASEKNNDISLDPVVDEALKKAGLMSDSPPNSPLHPTEGIDNNIVSPGKIDEEEPGNVLEIDSHPELDIYGDFEYNLEDDDFVGAGALNISNQQQEQPKIKLLFSSLNPEKSQGNLDSAAHQEVPTDAESSEGPSGLLDIQTATVKGASTLDNRVDDYLVQNSSVDNDEEPSLAECEELYGPDKEPLVHKYPETVPVAPPESSVKKELLSAENGDCCSNHSGKNSIQPTLDHVESSETSTTNRAKQQSNHQERESAVKDKKTTKHDTKHSEHNSEILKKVEAYIKEHIRPLCKSGVITVEQYRWAVGKTAEKVMKYHSKEKNANFLIKEGEKVKKLAEQYVEAAAQQKVKA